VRCPDTPARTIIERYGLTCCVARGPVDYTNAGGNDPVIVFGIGLLMNETQ